jgi:hypothetical protein
MKLIRNELKARGFRIEHESDLLTVMDNGSDDRRVILTASGTWQIFHRFAFNRWRKVQEGSDLSVLLTGLRRDEKAKA